MTGTSATAYPSLRTSTATSHPAGRPRGLDLAGSDVGDAEVGQAAIAVDPVVEEPAQVLVGGLFDGALEAFGIAVKFCIER